MKKKRSFLTTAFLTGLLALLPGQLEAADVKGPNTFEFEEQEDAELTELLRQQMEEEIINNKK